MISDLIGKKIEKIEGLVKGSDMVTITLADGATLVQEHYQECCENVEVEQVDGNIQRHVGALFMDVSEKVVDGGEDGFPDDYPCDEYSSCTATFYTLKTSRGYLDWRWVGESNGYYK